jgi:hypothetical protein
MAEPLFRYMKPFLPASARQTMLRSLSSLPHNRVGDYAWAFATFWHTFGRMPRRDSWLVNDVLFRIRTLELASPERTHITDKEHLRAYVAERAGDRYNVPVVAVLRTPEEAVAYDYPADCVIKPTHMSGELIFRRDGEPVDRARIAGWFGRNFYRTSREANYKRLVPKVIVEPYIFGRRWPEVPVDYRVFCVEGDPRMLLVEVDHRTSQRRIYFDSAWRLLPFTTSFPRYGDPPAKPDNLDEMLDVAARLSAGYSLLRVDLYSNGSEIQVGELTSCSGGGVTTYIPPEGETIASRLLWPEHWPAP